MLINNKNCYNYNYFVATNTNCLLGEAFPVFYFFVYHCPTWWWQMWTAETCSSSIEYKTKYI